MKNRTAIAAGALRLALSATLLSSVASRLGLWGAQSSGWESFLAYTAEVNSFAPAEVIPFLAGAATVLEILFGLLLLAGYKIRLAALGTAILTFLFALAIAWSFGLKSPLDYSVFVDSAAVFLLAAMPGYRWSLDEYLANRNQN